jgi:hypothetical protein
MTLDRKDFLKAAAAVAGAGLGLGELGACASDEGSRPAYNAGTGGTTGSGGASGTGGTSGTGGRGTGGSGNGGNGTGGSETGGAGSSGSGGGETGGTSGSGGSGGVDAGSSDDGGSVANVCDAHAPATMILMNHGHKLTVSKADAAAGKDKTYDIKGTAAHTHKVDVTAAMFKDLEAGQMVMTTSTKGGTGAGHTHAIQIECA